MPNPSISQILFTVRLSILLSTPSGYSCLILEETCSTSLDGAEDPSECGITEVPDNNYGSLSGAVERTRSLPSNDSRSSRIKRAVQAVHEQSRLRSRQKAQEHSPQIKATYRDPSSNPIDQDSQIEGDRLASLDNDTQNTVSVNNLSTKQKRLKGDGNSIL